MIVSLKLRPVLSVSLGVIMLSTFTKALSTASSSGMVNRPVSGLKNGMDYVKLGSSDLEVSRVCMGTMTFGEVSEKILKILSTIFPISIIY